MPTGCTATPSRVLSLPSYNPLAINNVSNHRTWKSLALHALMIFVYFLGKRLFTGHTASPEQSGDGQIARAIITGTRAPVPATMAQRGDASYCSTVSSITILFLPLHIYRVELVPG